jgi:hypothetical protein
VQYEGSSLTGFGGVSSDLPFKALQILQHHGIIADKYILSPHSANLFVPVESREAAVKVCLRWSSDCFAQKDYATAQCFAEVLGSLP